MKKMFAFLSAVLMAFSCMAVSASATEEQVVIAVRDNPSGWWVTQTTFAHSPMFYYPELPRPIDNYYMSSKKIADFNPAQETFEIGDIIEFKNLAVESPLDWGGTFDTDMYTPRVEDEDQPYSIYKIGSIFDNPEIVQFTVTGSFTYYLNLLDNEKNHYEYKCDWLKSGFYQPDCVDLTSLHSGDVVSCITYNDIPMVITEVTSAAPPSGDADGDGKLDILDVITVNRAVLGKESLSADRAYHADLNQSGAPDPLDSMLMMRKIVGLD